MDTKSLLSHKNQFLRNVVFGTLTTDSVPREYENSQLCRTGYKPSAVIMRTGQSFVKKKSKVLFFFFFKQLLLEEKKVTDEAKKQVIQNKVKNVELL